MRLSNFSSFPDPTGRKVAAELRGHRGGGPGLGTNVVCDAMGKTDDFLRGMAMEETQGQRGGVAVAGAHRIRNRQGGARLMKQTTLQPQGAAFSTAGGGYRP